MPIYFMTTALLIVSLVTNLTVEGIKKLLNETTIKYSSNVLAAVVAVLMSCAVCVIYLIMNDVAFTLKVGVEVCILMYLSFLTSTVGYDKVIQMIQQIRDTKEDGTPSVGNSYSFVQNNYSPKALSRIDIYRQTKNQFSALKGLVET